MADTIGTSGNGVVLLLSSGAGGLKPATTLAIGFDPIAAVIGDFNGDGHLDIAVIDYSSSPSLVILYGNLTLLANDGHGSFCQPTASIDTPPSGYIAERLVRGDVNGDGKPDLAWVDNPESGSQVPTAWSSLNSGETFATKQKVATLSAGLGNLLASDVDLDGKTDLIGWTSQLVEQCCTANPVTIFYSAGAAPSPTFTSTAASRSRLV